MSWDPSRTSLAPISPVDHSLEHARVQKCASHIFRIEGDPVDVRPIGSYRIVVHG